MTIKTQTKITDLTRGKLLEDGSGKIYLILSKEPQSAGTVGKNGIEPNYVIMARPEGSRAVDLFISQSSLDLGHYSLGK